MAIKTRCQTPGAVFQTHINGTLGLVEVTVILPPERRPLRLTTPQAKVLEANLHNAVEMVLARYFTEEDPS